jgi:hypothetical protein
MITNWEQKVWLELTVKRILAWKIFEHETIF